MVRANSSPATEGARRDTNARPTVLFIAGFGDNASMFAGLHETALADAYCLTPLDLPGFGAPALDMETTSLQSLAEFVARKAKETGAEIIVAHSVASIIASLAARETDCPITTILSLEGNITAEDAYFSGIAADYDDPYAFRTAFLGRLAEMAESAPIITRYHMSVSAADPVALWQLGKDARRFSTEKVPGEILASAAKVTYLYNPDNCPESTLEWLRQYPMERIVLANATHWASVDQPKLLAEKILTALH
jgi:pimeloyl-ACP methyl ester carboxylesterase